MQFIILAIAAIAALSLSFKYDTPIAVTIALGLLFWLVLYMIVEAFHPSQPDS